MVEGTYRACLKQMSSLVSIRFGAKAGSLMEGGP